MRVCARYEAIDQLRLAQISPTSSVLAQIGSDRFRSGTCDGVPENASHILHTFYSPITNIVYIGVGEAQPASRHKFGLALSLREASGKKIRGHDD